MQQSGTAGGDGGPAAGIGQRQRSGGLEIEVGGNGGRVALDAADRQAARIVKVDIAVRGQVDRADHVAGGQSNRAARPGGRCSRVQDIRQDRRALLKVGAGDGGGSRTDIHTVGIAAVADDNRASAAQIDTGVECPGIDVGGTSQQKRAARGANRASVDAVAIQRHAELRGGDGAMARNGGGERAAIDRLHAGVEAGGDHDDLAAGIADGLVEDDGAAGLHGEGPPRGTRAADVHRGIDGDVVAGLERQIGGLQRRIDRGGDDGRGEAVVVGEGQAGGRGAGRIDNDICRVQQPLAGMAEWGQGVHCGVGKNVQIVARGFHLATIAAGSAAARTDRAGKIGRAVGPDRHLAAIAGIDGIGLDHRLADTSVLGMLFDAAALEIATDHHHAAAGTAGDVHVGAITECDVLAQHLDRAAGFARALARSVECTGIDYAAAFSFQDDFAIHFAH